MIRFVCCKAMVNKDIKMFNVDCRMFEVVEGE